MESMGPGSPDLRTQEVFPCAVFIGGTCDGGTVVSMNGFVEGGRETDVALSSYRG